MYLRFVVNDVHPESERELGVFQAIHILRQCGRLSNHEVEQDDLLRRWFNQNLAKPARFTTAKPPFHRRKSRALSWFKDDAFEHISRVRSLAAILHRHGYSVRMLKTDRVGYVVYEDEYQIVAEPFRGDPY